MSLPEPEFRRIVSLVPAATETLFVIGAWERVVGVSHACDFPPMTNGLARVTRSRVDPGLRSRELDAQVKALRANGESVVALDVERLDELRPDLLIAQTVCEACAIAPKDVEHARARIGTHPNLHSYDATTFETTLKAIRDLGARVGASEGAKREILKQWSLAKEIRSRTKEFDRPRVAVLDWLDPLMFAGHWTKELVEMAGGEYGLVETGRPSRFGTWDELETYDPDVIVASPCGRGLEGAADELAGAIRLHVAWDVTAVAKNRLWAADGDAYFNRPGPRLIYSAALLARALHPELPELPPALEKGIARLEVPR